MPFKHARSDSASTPSSTTLSTAATAISPRHSLPSPPTTPLRNHSVLPIVSHLLTPVSSKSSLSSSAYIVDGRQPQVRPHLPASPASAARAHPNRRPPSSYNDNTASPSRPSSLRNKPFQLTPPALILHLNLRSSSYASDMSGVSRASSPQGRQRALSPTRRPSISRPPSRCEALLRDTLRKNDVVERESFRSSGENRSIASGSSVPAVPNGSRSRGRSILGTRNQPTSDEFSDAQFFDEAGMFSANGRGSMDFLYRAAPQPSHHHHNAHLRGWPIGSPPEVTNLPYGSPSSPTPMPPTMHRTRTAPAVPRASSKALALDLDSTTTRPPHSPARHTLPNMAGVSHVVSPAGPSGSSSSSSSDSSPKLRLHSVSPHEAVLRAKLESVLRAGSTPPEDRDSHPSSAGRARHHHRAHTHTHGVTPAIQTNYHDDPASISPQASCLRTNFGLPLSNFLSHSLSRRVRCPIRRRIWRDMSMLTHPRRRLRRPTVGTRSTQTRVSGANITRRAPVPLSLRRKNRSRPRRRPRSMPGRRRRCASGWTGTSRLRRWKGWASLPGWTWTARTMVRMRVRGNGVGG